MLASIYFSIGLWLVPHHEMWRDELQAWLLARDSSSVIELFHNLRYEGHPALWHLLLMPLTRIFESPVAMQYCNLLIATASVYVLARYSPFSWQQKVLLAFGYYLFYEYGIIARNYSIGVFLVFVYCALFSCAKRRYLALGLILFLLSQTSVFGLIFAMALFVGLLVEQLLPIRAPYSLNGDRGSAYAGGLIAVVGFVSAVVQLKPPSDSGFATTWMFQYDLEQLKSTLGALVDAYFPIPKIELNYWNKRYLAYNSFTSITFTVFSLSIFLAFARLLLSRFSVAATYFFCNIGLLSFFYIKYPGSWRHHGFLFLALIVALWLAPCCRDSYIKGRERKQTLFPESLLNRLFSILLAIQLIGGAIAAYQDYKYPFSQAKYAAKYITDHRLEGLEIVGDGSPQTSAIVGYLKPLQFYYTDAGRYGSFIKWDKKIQTTKQNDLFSKMLEISMRNPEGGLLILNYPIDSGNVKNLKFDLLYAFGPSVVVDESFYIYRFVRGDDGSQGLN